MSGSQYPVRTAAGIAQSLRERGPLRLRGTERCTPKPEHSSRREALTAPHAGPSPVRAQTASACASGLRGTHATPRHPSQPANRPAGVPGGAALPRTPEVRVGHRVRRHQQRSRHWLGLGICDLGPLRVPRPLRLGSGLGRCPAPSAVAARHVPGASGSLAAAVPLTRTGPDTDHRVGRCLPPPLPSSGGCVSVSRRVLGPGSGGPASSGLAACGGRGRPRVECRPRLDADSRRRAGPGRGLRAGGRQASGSRAPCRSAVPP